MLWKTHMYVAGAGLAALGIMIAEPALAQGLWDSGYGFDRPPLVLLTLTRIVLIAGSTAAGFCIGWFCSPHAKELRRALLVLVLGAACFIALFDHGLLGWQTALILAVVGFFAGLGYWMADALRKAAAMPTTFGSSKWADADDLNSKGLFGTDGIVLGAAYNGEKVEKFSYKGDRHLLTVAPTRSGKGVAHIIPNLLTYGGSTLVIDPKGENAMITARARADMGQEVLAVDPWGITAGTEGLMQARFNPLDWLQLGDVDITENAMLLTDAIVQPQSGKADPFWREEAKALIQGLLMYVAVDEAFDGKRHLGTVRDLLLLSGDEMTKLFQEMANSPHQVVASTGARSLQKEEKLMANVLASAQAETHMLDSMRLRESLSTSDFSFEDMKTKPMTIYLILPADRLETFNRFLRLLVQQAITVNARNIEAKPEKPVLFILDEMAALGRLAMVEQAYGLMAGFGIQLWGVVQDLCQLRRVYGEDYESFIANAGAVAYFGSPDKRSAEYFSALCGVTTVWSLSIALAESFQQTFSAQGSSSGRSTTFTDTRSTAQRKLAYPDELMRLKADRQLILIEDTYPIMARKTRWFIDPALKDKGVSLHG